MDLARNRTGRSAFLVGLAALLTTLALLSASNTYVANSGSVMVSTYPVSWRMALSWGLIQWYLWIPAIPLAMRLPQWVPLRGSLLKPMAAISTAAILTAALHACALFLIAKRAKWYLSYVMITDFLEGLLIFVAALAVVYAWTYYHEAQRGKLESARLESQLAKANLDALRMQLNPHFLFNTLNTISSLQMTNASAAQKMIAQLGDFLRITLRASSNQEVPLAEEMEFVHRYLEIERARLGDRLVVECNVDPQLNSALVPNLILQPLIENAFKHAISEVAQNARLEISASKIDLTLMLRVRDNGPGCPDLRSRNGIGLRNIKERLEQLYGQRATFCAENANGGGFCAIVSIPYREAAIVCSSSTLAYVR